MHDRFAPVISCLQPPVLMPRMRVRPCQLLADTSSRLLLSCFLFLSDALPLSCVGSCRVSGLLRAGQTMYVAVVQPSGGAASSLGVMLQSCQGPGMGGQEGGRICVGEVLPGSAAAADGRIKVGDLITAVDGISVEGKTAQETEILMSGPIWRPVVVAAQRPGAQGEEGAYRVELVRGFGHEEAAAATALIGAQHTEACSLAEKMREDLDTLHAQVQTEQERHEETIRVMRVDRDRLQVQPGRSSCCALIPSLPMLAVCLGSWRINDVATTATG
jgi:hypothetical protein